MGEYFDWVNVDKREYICPGDFDYGNKFRETTHKDSVPLHALHVLLNENWKGDHVIWLGDECAIPNQSSNIVFKILYEQSKVYYSLEETEIFHKDGRKNVYSDPLPILMGYGKTAEPGEWLGDVIGVSDQRPEGYSPLKKIYLDWQQFG